VRAGAQALSLLSIPLNVRIIESLETGPQPLLQLRRELGAPPPTTLRGHLRKLDELHIVERRREGSFPGPMRLELAPAGRDLLRLAAIVETWLGKAPTGEVEIGSVAGKSAIKALIGAWSSGMLRALAAKPWSLTDLNRLITSLNYPTLERRLAAMRLAGQLEVRTGGGRSRPYAVTDWLRRGVAPLLAATGWERRHRASHAPPLGRIDVEAIFLLAVPLLDLSPEHSGTCRLVVDVPGSAGRRVAGCVMSVAQGRVASCSASLEGKAEAWVSGPSSGWLAALTAGEVAGLEVGGEVTLAGEILSGLHNQLFRVVVPR
jgi:DNA-binding HxlR family transcriptional regulator